MKYKPYEHEEIVDIIKYGGKFYERRKKTIEWFKPCKSDV